MTDGIPTRLLERKRKELLGKRTFGAADLERLAALAKRADEVVPVGEAFARRDDHPERFLALRHDMDNDLENSVRIAEWEAARGLRATYYVLHTDWYWGADGAVEPSAFALKALDRIAGLGHEIGIHNNAITAALVHGGDPVQILEGALGALRKHGFEVTGSVAHGDRLCRTLGYVNSEIFSDLPRPELGAPDRTIAYTDAKRGRTRVVRLSPVPMADLGLTHEANFIGRTLYLSDVGGRWQQPFRQMDHRFAGEGGFLEVLVHPMWWALGGEDFAPRSTIAEVTADEAARAAAGDPAAPVLPIVVRGDCCSRRAIDMNRDLFGGNPVMVRDEKARTDFFLDHLTVGSASRADIERYLDVDSMSSSLRRYALGQTDRATLAVDGARLLVMDDYSDMNFAAWRHRKLGWKIWIHPGHLRDRGAFEAEFEPCGQLSFEESLEAHVRLIGEYRRRNGDIPVLYFHQPIAYYRKLQPRSAFRRLGGELERAVPGLYATDLHEADLEVDDMGSSGPGQTLHFTGPTYRRMIQIALDKGLAEWLKAQPTIAIPN